MIKREGSVENIHVQVKRMKEHGISDEDISMQGSEMLQGAESEGEQEPGSETGVDPTSVAASALLQTPLDEGQLHMMQIAASHF